MITYNHAPYIKQAIEGVLQQKTIFPYELVIGEDCSTDNTRDIVHAYHAKYPELIRIITSDNNVGMKNNSLRVGKACRGKYIALCEGDDYWHNPLKLQKQADYLEAHPACGLVHSNYDVYEEATKTTIKDYIAYKKFIVPQRPTISEVITGSRDSFRIQTCTVMFRRALYEEIIAADPYLHQSGHFLMGDTQLWAEFAAKSDIEYMPDTFATYRLLMESASRSNDRHKYMRFEQSDYDMKMYLCDKYRLPDAVRKQAGMIWFTAALRYAFHEMDANLADEVRKHKKTLNMKEWIQYFGARNRAIHYASVTAALIRDLFSAKKIHA